MVNGYAQQFADVIMSQTRHPRLVDCRKLCVPQPEADTIDLRLPRMPEWAARMEGTMPRPLADGVKALPAGGDGVVAYGLQSASVSLVGRRLYNSMAGATLR